MSIYDVNINDVSLEILPPDKRNTNIISILQSLLTPLQWKHDLFFNSYYGGATCPQYAPGTYNYLQQVIYNKQVYSSLKNGNTDAPTVTTSWQLVQNNFIGLKERILYNGQKIVLEYALNKEFNTVFRQPPNTSDIHITNIASVKSGFLVGITEPNCSSVGQTTSSDGIGVGPSPFVYLTNFQINIPNAALALTNSQAITNFVNQYIPASLIFTVVGY